MKQTATKKGSHFSTVRRSINVSIEKPNEDYIEKGSLGKTEGAENAINR